jgi:hypothetical protein
VAVLLHSHKAIIWTCDRLTLYFWAWTYITFNGASVLFKSFPWGWYLAMLKFDTYEWSFFSIVQPSWQVDGWIHTCNRALTHTHTCVCSHVCVHICVCVRVCKPRSWLDYGGSAEKLCLQMSWKWNYPRIGEAFFKTLILCSVRYNGWHLHIRFILLL